MQKIKLLLPILLLTSTAVHAVSSSLYLAGALASGAFAAWNGYMLPNPPPTKENLQNAIKVLDGIQKFNKHGMFVVADADVWRDCDYMTKEAQEKRSNEMLAKDPPAFYVEMYKKLPFEKFTDEEVCFREKIIKGRKDFLKGHLKTLNRFGVSISEQCPEEQWLSLTTDEIDGKTKSVTQVRCSASLLEVVKKQKKSVSNNIKEYDQLVANHDSKQRNHYLGLAAGIGLGGLCLWQWLKK